MLRVLLFFLVLLIIATCAVAIVAPHLVKYAVIPLLIIAFIILLANPDIVPSRIKSRLSETSSQT